MRTLRLRKFEPVPSLPAMDHGARRDRLVLLLHGSDCPHCAEVTAGLVACRAEWEGWGVSPVILRDASPGLRRQFGGDEADAVLMTVEPQGRLMDGWAVTHPAPVDWAAVLASVRWMATHNTECARWEAGWEDADGY